MRSIYPIKEMVALHVEYIKGLDGWNELKCGDVDAKATPIQLQGAIRAHLVPACAISIAKDDWFRIALIL